MVHQTPRVLAACDTPVTSSSAGPGNEASAFDSLIAETERQLPAKGADFQSLLNQIVELAKILTGASGAAMAFRGEQGTVCRARIGTGAPPIGAPVDVTSGICKQCLDTGISLRSDDIATDPRIDGGGTRGVAVRAIAVVAIYSAGKINGILAVFSSIPAAFTDQHLQKLKRLAKLVDTGSSTASDEARRSPTVDVPIKAEPALNLLVVPEPGYLRFFHNLSELVSRRSTPVRGESFEAHGWDHVFVQSKSRWQPFIESAVLHIVAVAMLLGVSRLWPRELIVYSHPLRDARVTYYPASQSYPARASSRPVARPRLQHALAKTTVPGGQGRQAPLVVASGIGNPSGRKAQGPTAAPPGMPAAAANGWQKLRLGAANSPLPAPPVNGLQSRLANLPSGAVVAPSPELGGASGLRRFSERNTSVVPPSPNVGGLTGRTGGIRRGAPGAGSPVVSAMSIVPPPPNVNEHAKLTYDAAGLVSDAGAQVIAPPPSIQGQGQGGFGRRGRSVGLGGGSPDIVPPPPSVQDGPGAGISSGGRGNSLGSGASQVVPPAPSVQGEDGLRGRGTSIATGAGGSGIVPPPPSVQGGAGRGISPGGRGNSLVAGDGSGVVPPPPSVGGGAGGGISSGGRGNSLAGGGGSGVVPPAPSVGGGGDSLGGGRGGSLAGAGDGVGLAPGGAAGGAPVAGAGGGPAPPNVPSSSLPRVGSNQPRATFQDLHLRVVSLAMSLPSSSYFSNYEVFVAERWLSKTESQLIKLVYVFLPYQRRLSQSGDLTKVFKVRVTRDPTCDESLMQIMWPDDPKAGSKTNSQAAAPDPADRKNMLPCYRTTADDYRKALSRKR